MSDVLIRSIGITDEAVILEYMKAEDLAANGMERARVLAIPVGVCDEQVETLLQAAEDLLDDAEQEFAAAGPPQFEDEDDDAPSPYDNPNDRHGEG